MVRVFIVDDEKWVRESVKHAIRWEENGFEIVGEEDDGLDALGKVLELRPHIVIADIRMPGLDGIELFKLVKTQLPHTLFIFISGYSHFNYVQDALNLGAFNYILKPIDGGKLLEVLHNARNKTLQAEQSIRDQHMAKHSLNMLKNQFLSALLEGTRFSDKTLAAKLRQFGISFPFDGFIVLRVVIDNYRSLKQHLQYNDIELLSFALHNISEEIIARFGLVGVMASFPHGEHAILINIQRATWEESEQYLRTAAEAIASSVKQYQYFTVTIGTGSLVSELGRVSESDAEARKSLDYRMELGNDRVISMADRESIREEQFDLLLVEEETELLKLLDGRRRAAFNERIDTLFGSLSQRQMHHPHKLAFLFRHICGLIFMMAARKGHSTSHLQEEQKSLYEQLDGLEQADELGELLKGVADRYLLAEEATDSGEKVTVIRKMREYVYAHYGEKVDLQVLAKHLYMHPVYLSKIFKQETGENFTDFLLDYRMSTAKELMRHKAYELSDIARMVGFEDYSYFNKQFRKVAGISPQEYRRTVEMIP